jgi:pimeloyl-ACP methyl ester carboxylesterase
MNVDRFVLVGHSLGAVIATAYTQRFPTRVEHLVLASPAHGKGFIDGPVPPIFRVVAFFWNHGVRRPGVVQCGAWGVEDSNRHVSVGERLLSGGERLLPLSPPPPPLPLCVGVWFDSLACNFVACARGHFGPGMSCPPAYDLQPVCAAGVCCALTLPVMNFRWLPR